MDVQLAHTSQPASQPKTALSLSRLSSTPSNKTVLPRRRKGGLKDNLDGKRSRKTKSLPGRKRGWGGRRGGRERAQPQSKRGTSSPSPCPRALKSHLSKAKFKKKARDYGWVRSPDTRRGQDLHLGAFMACFNLIDCFYGLGRYCFIIVVSRPGPFREEQGIKPSR